MYVCNCNGITEKEVDEAVRSGAERWDDVHTYFDCAPCCGKCECDIAEAICIEADSLSRLKSFLQRNGSGMATEEGRLGICFFSWKGWQHSFKSMFCRSDLSVPHDS